MGAVPPVPAKAFDFANVVLTFDDTVIVGGNSIKASYDSAATTDDVGADGSVVVVVSNDQRGTLEVELTQGSPSINYLSAQVALFLATKAFKPVQLEDLNGSTIAVGAQAWVEKVADGEFGKEQAGRTFRIRVANMRMVAGGLNDT